jgi:hypothetical protein
MVLGGVTDKGTLKGTEFMLSYRIGILGLLIAILSLRELRPMPGASP